MIQKKGYLQGIYFSHPELEIICFSFWFLFFHLTKFVLSNQCIIGKILTYCIHVYPKIWNIWYSMWESLNVPHKFTFLCWKIWSEYSMKASNIVKCTKFPKHRDVQYFFILSMEDWSWCSWCDCVTIYRYCRCKMFTFQTEDSIISFLGSFIDF